MKQLMKLYFVMLILTTTLFAQAGTKLIGFNAQTIGRAGTSIGNFDSNELMMTNPAGISFLKKSSLDLDLSFMFPTLHFKNNLNDIDGDKNTFPLPTVSYVNNYDDKFSWGIGLFTAGGMGADFKLTHALYGTAKQEYHSKLALMQGGISAAYKFNENLSVGVSAHLVYSMLEFAMPFSLNPLSMAGVANPMTGMTFGQMFAAPNSVGGFGYTEVTASAKMNDLSALGFNGKIGLVYKVSDELSFGLSYSSPIDLTYKNGTATMDMTQQLNDAFGKAVMGWMMQNPGKSQQEAQAAIMGMFAQLGIDMSKGVVANYDLNVDLSFPQIIGFGISYKPMSNLKLSSDVEILSWESAFDNMTLKLSNGKNANINKMMGNNGAFDIEFPLKWKNSVLVKIGAEYCVTKELVLRGGFAHNQNPVPESTIFPVFPAIVENHLTIGAGYKLSENFIVNAAFEMGLNNSLKASNPSLIANEYSNSTSELATTLIHFSFSYSF